MGHWNRQKVQIVCGAILLTVVWAASGCDATGTSATSSQLMGTSTGASARSSDADAGLWRYENTDHGFALELPRTWQRAWVPPELSVVAAFSPDTAVEPRLRNDLYVMVLPVEPDVTTDMLAARFNERRSEQVRGAQAATTLGGVPARLLEREFADDDGRRFRSIDRLVVYRGQCYLIGFKANEQDFPKLLPAANQAMDSLRWLPE